jgi:cholest-4-en-3-one 26-monooxygenase
MQRPVEFPEIDLSDVDAFNDGPPHEWFTTLRNQAPIWWQDEPDGPGFWNITKYADLKFASKTPKLFSSWAGGTNMFELNPEDLESVRLMMINMDPPQHAKFRRLVSQGFTPKRIAMLEEHTRELAKKIVDDVAERGECEFVDDVAARLPMETICEMVGVPESDRRHVYDLSNRLIGFDDPDFQTDMDQAAGASAEMFAYAETLAAEKKKCPLDDLATILVNGELDGERLTPLEFDSFFLILAIAGNETTRTVTAQGMRLLMEHPEQRARLRENPSLLPGAVEEILRHNPAVMHFRRTMTEDFEMGGQRLRAGEKVIMWYPSANRDEDVYSDGQAFDIARTPNEHLAFGVGEHFCLGANLARLQLNSIFGELVRRLGDAEPAGPVRRLRSNFIDGIKEMPVTFTPESKQPRRAT